MGWRLNTASSIIRAGVRRGAPSYDASDLILLDGEELVECASGVISPSCAANGTHTTRVESFQRISYDGDRDRWTVWRKDGTSSTYESQIRRTSGRATYRWALSHVQDTHGNRVDYSYWCDGAADECYVSSITYGGGIDCGTIPDGTVGARLEGAEIRFLWQPRASVVSHAIGDRLLTTRYKLGTIDVKMAGRRVRAIRLDYTTSRVNDAPLLASVQEFGNDAVFDPNTGVVTGGTGLPKRTFSSDASMRTTGTWSGSVNPISATGAFPSVGPPWPAAPYTDTVTRTDWYTPSNYSFRWLAGDVNGDGLADLTVISTGAIGTMIAHRDGTFTSVIDSLTGWDGATSVNPASNVFTYMADFDGDGKADVMQALDHLSCDAMCPCGITAYCHHTAFRLALSNGDGTHRYIQHDTSTPFTPQVHTTNTIGWAINIGFAGGLDVSIPVASGVIWQWDNLWLEDNWFVGDVDGDGKADFYGVTRYDHRKSGGGTYKAIRLHVVRSLGTDVSSTDQTTDTDWAWEDNYSTKTRLFTADVDGDMKTDFMFVHRHAANLPGHVMNGEHAALAVALSNGDGTFRLSSQETPWAWSDDDVWFPGDQDGDGRADMLHVAYRAQNAAIKYPHAAFDAALSHGTGNGFTFTPVTETDMVWHLPIPCVGNWTPAPWMPADMDGDGRTDILHPYIQHEYNCLTNPTAPRVKLEAALSVATGQFQTIKTSFSVPWYDSQQVAALAADINGDGKDDMIWAREVIPNGDLLKENWSVAVGFSPNAAWDMWRWAPTDINGDGRLDLVYTYFMNPGYRIYTLIAQPGGGYVRKEWTILPSADVPGLDHPSAMRWVLADVGGGIGNAPDGKADLILVDQDDVKQTLRVYSLISKGDGTWAATYKEWPTTGMLSLPTRQWLPGDVDGDGRADLVTVVTDASGTKVHTLQSQASDGWSWLTPFAISPTVVDPQLFQMADVNGDGRGDLVYVTQAGGATTVRSYLSQGNGAFVKRSATVPVGFVDTANWRAMELNGDGMTDLAYLSYDYSTPSLRVQMLVSTGDATTWKLDTSPTLSTGLPTHPDRQNFRAMDVNDDRRTDMVYVTSGPGALGFTETSLVTLINLYPGWMPQTQRGLPFAFDNARSWRPMDSTTDGLPDLVHVHPDLYTLQLDVPRMRISHEEFGAGGYANIGYGTSAGKHQYLPVGALVSMVTSISTGDGVGAAGIVETTTYDYEDALWSDAQRRFLGFRKRTASDGTTLIERTYERGEQCPPRPSQTHILNTAGVLYAKMSSLYVASTGNGQAPYTCLPEVEEADECEGTSSCRQTRTTHEYDAYGNDLRTSELGAIGDRSDDRLTVVTVYANKKDYIVGLPASVDVYGLDTASGLWSTVPTASTRFLYDGNATHAVPPGPVGELRQLQRWDNTTGGYATTTIEYELNGNTRRIAGPPTPTNPSGVWRQTTYDCAFKLYPVSQCNARYCKELDWDPIRGLVTRGTDPNHQSTRFVYDPVGRPILVTRADGSFERTTYPPQSTWATPAQHVLHERSADASGGVLSSRSYIDGLGREIRKVDQGRYTRQTTYDGASSRVGTQSNVYGPGETPLWTKIDYDVEKRPWRKTPSDSTNRRNLYSVGVVTQRDELNHDRSYYRDGHGRITAVNEANQSCPPGVTECHADQFWTFYRYDPLDRLSATIDNAGNRTELKWDSLSRKQRMCDRDSGCWSYSYFADGALATQTDSNANRVEIVYDELGRPIAKHWYDRTGANVRDVALTWDAPTTGGVPHGASVGRLVEVRESRPGGPSGHVTVTDEYSYDVLGRVQMESRCIGSQCAAWRTDYDLAGRVARITYPDSAGQVSPASEQVDYHYATDGRLHEVPGYVVKLGYDSPGHVRHVLYANGATEDHVYDPAREWLRHVEVRDASGAPAYIADLQHDLAGRIHRLTSTSPTTVDLTLWYDSIGRLTQVDSPDPQHARRYAYDSIGNMTYNSSVGVYHYDDPRHVHAVTSTDAGKHYSYDLRGGMLFTTDRDFVWDETGMPVQITNHVNGTTVLFEYDSEERRTRKTGPQGTTYYFGPLVERDANGSLVTYYYAGGRRIARRDGLGVAFYHDDQVGSTRAMTDDSGAVANRYDYGPFGERLLEKEKIANDYAFGGKGGDDETGLIYMNARYYDPDLARFVSADTIVPDLYNPQALNRYSFALNNPISFADPSGHEAIVIRDPGGTPMFTLVQPRTPGGYTVVPPGHTANEHASKHQRTANPRSERARGPGDTPRPSLPPLSPPPLVSSDPTGDFLSTARESTRDISLFLAAPPAIASAFVGGAAAAAAASGAAEVATAWSIRAVAFGQVYLPRVAAVAIGVAGGGSLQTGGALGSVEDSVTTIMQNNNSGSSPYDLDTSGVMDEHHIFPQQFEEWFNVHGIDIHESIAVLPTEVHKAIHRAGWNARWQEYIDSFLGKPGPSPSQIHEFAVKLMEEFRILEVWIKGYRVTP